MFSSLTIIYNRTCLLRSTKIMIRTYRVKHSNSNKLNRTSIAADMHLFAITGIRRKLLLFQSKSNAKTTHLPFETCPHICYYPTLTHSKRTSTTTENIFLLKFTVYVIATLHSDEDLQKTNPNVLNRVEV